MWLIRVFLLLTLAIIIKNNNVESLKILGVFPLPGKSHFSTGEELFKILAQKGHQIDVVSHFPQKKPFKNYHDISLAGSAPIPVNNVTFASTRAISGFGLDKFIRTTGLETCELLAHPNMQALLKKPKGSYDVIIIEVFTFNCYFALGKHFDAPVIAVSTLTLPDWLFAPFSSPFNPSYMPMMVTGYGQEMTFYQRLVNTLISYVTPTLFHYYLEEERIYVEKYFGRKLSSIQELYDDVSLLFVNSHYSINGIKPLAPEIIEIGGLHVGGFGQELTEDLKKWLDESTHGCVYISFGSMVRIETLPADKIQAFYQMFNNISPVRVLMKIADPKLLPPNLPKNVMTSSWLPQVAVLKHKQVKAFVTHGGLMGTQEAIGWGVPLVGLPLFGDQITNIQNYVNQKIAVKLDVDNFNSETLTNAVKEILNNPEYMSKMKEVSALFMDRPMSAKDTAIYWVEYAARHGSRLKSPARKLTWWQYYLVDVYGVILGTILLVLYIVKKILMFVYYLICSKKNQKEKLSKNKKDK